MKQTKGKWEVVFSGYSETYSVDCGDQTICSLWHLIEETHDFYPYENAEANAKLIATSPELLEACRETKKLLDEVANMNIQPFPVRALQLNRNLIRLLHSIDNA